MLEGNFPDMSDGEVLARTLALVNVFRTAAKWKIIRSMPRGVPRHPSRCPLNRALGANGIGCFYIGFSDRHLKRVADVTWFGAIDVNTIHLTRIPLILDEFITRFDAGRYPELIQQD